uniref:CRN-like CRN13 n=1 Tax=Phytophthora infestans TaxID=4787 RepID=Q2M400_PHYIN|nr:CRN-like CRN13 [Phytophthora infestans]
MVKLFCSIVGVAGSAFSVEVDEGKTVDDLKEAIKAKKANDFKEVDADKLQLFLAKKKKGAGVWLTENDVKVGVSDTSDLKLLGVAGAPLGLVGLSEKEVNFVPTLEDVESMNTPVQVLVALPPWTSSAPISDGTNLWLSRFQHNEYAKITEFPEAAEGGAPYQQTGLWLVRGSVANALSTKGVRCRLYRLAGTYLGYYDPTRRTGDKNTALWYEDNTLCINVLFKTEENALRFDNSLQEEPVTLGSPLNGQEVTTSVAHVGGLPTKLKRIYFVHYDPQDPESPQDTISSISLSTSVTVLDTLTDEFQFQRIEHEMYFLPYGKAESCHLVSKKKCTDRDFKREFAKYDRDANNRLALSREMHGFYDGLSMEVPIVNMFPGCVDATRSVNNRYKVEVFVKVLDAQCKDRVFSRLKEGAEQTDDPLMMKTFVYVENPDTFCFCLKWKYDENNECWSSFLTMTPAVD